MRRSSVTSALAALTGALVVPAAVAAALAACKAGDKGTIQIMTDDEAGTFSRPPAPTELQVVAVSGPDASAVLATAALPTSTIDLGQVSEGLPLASIQVRGTDGTGALRVFGATLAVNFAALPGVTLPVFVQRTGEFARLPGTLSDSRTAPLLAVIQGEYLLVAGGAETATAQATKLYDFGSFTTFASPPALPMAPESVAMGGTIAWLVNATTGTYFDFATSGHTALSPPAGGTFADVAGGATTGDSKGVQYIVGATRTAGAPTRSVLKVDPSDTSDSSYPYGKPTWINLATPRLGAAAAWVEGRGLVVVGGAGSGDAGTTNAVEVIAPAALTGVNEAYAIDDRTGAGAAALDANRLVVAGGVTPAGADPGVDVIDLGCTPGGDAGTCVTPWVRLPVVLETAQVFAWTSTEALVVGNERGTGATHVYRVAQGKATEVPTRGPHTNARAAWSPVGSIVLLGGSPVLESFTP